jgi:tRNA-2-methylthio-N6-dimethylallyladenosine synthase
LPNEFSDSEIVASILKKDGFDTTSEIKKQTSFPQYVSIRKAEQTVRSRLTYINSLKKNNQRC